MDRNYKVALAALMGSILTVSCSSPVTTKDIVGTWRNQSGARMIFKSNGSFIGEHLPGGNVFWPSENFAGFNGFGHWKLGVGDKEGQLILNFDNNLPGVKNLPGMKSGFDTQLLMDRSDSGWYLYGWVGEEGGERFRFERIK
jgi:hypothetical protein